jgi:hypothetical protein
MKLLAVRSFVALLALLGLLASPSHAAELDEHLLFLTPLIGKVWVGSFAGSDSPDIRIVLGFEQVLGGKSVRYVREAEAARYSAATNFYWNPSREAVCFLSLNNRGIVGEGVVSAEEGKIVLRGMSHWPDRTIDFRTTFEIDAIGILRDTYIRMEAGEWVPGHVQVFVATE